MVFEGDFNTGAYASWGPTVANRVPVHASGPYVVPNYRAIGRAIHSNGPTSGAFRGFGVPQAAILQETLYDELALKLGQDRLAFRKLNAMRDGAVTATGQLLEAGVGIVECLEALEAPWQEALLAAAAFNEAESGPLRQGVGVASCWYGCGKHLAAPIPRPSRSESPRWARSCCTRALRTSVKAPTRSSPRSVPTPWACRSAASD